MSDPRLTTDRLVLRRMVLADAPALHVALSDPAAMRFWSTLPHDSLAVTEAWVMKTIASVDAGEADDFAVLLDGRVIGKAGLWKGHEIGVILTRRSWGRGLAAEALGAVIDRAFRMGVDRITADIDPRNLSSLKLFRKLGFRQTGAEQATFLVGEEWTDSTYHELTAEDWSGSASRAQ